MLVLWHLCFRLVFSYNKEDILGRHDAPVRCVEYSYAAGLFCSTYVLLCSFKFFGVLLECHDFEQLLNNDNNKNNQKEKLTRLCHANPFFISEKGCIMLVLR